MPHFHRVHLSRELLRSPYLHSHVAHLAHKGSALKAWVQAHVHVRCAASAHSLADALALDRRQPLAFCFQRAGQVRDASLSFHLPSRRWPRRGGMA